MDQNNSRSANGRKSRSQIPVLPLSPVDMRSSDPGDATARNFRYQHAYGAMHRSEAPGISPVSPYGANTTKIFSRSGRIFIPGHGTGCPRSTSAYASRRQRKFAIN